MTGDDWIAAFAQHADCFGLRPGVKALAAELAFNPAGIDWTTGTTMATIKELALAFGLAPSTLGSYREDLELCGWLVMVARPSGPEHRATWLAEIPACPRHGQAVG